MALILTGRLATSIQRIDGVTPERLSAKRCRQVLSEAYPHAADLRLILNSLDRGRARSALARRGIALAETANRQLHVVIHAKKGARVPPTVTVHHCDVPLPDGSLRRVSTDLGLGAGTYVTSPALAWMLASSKLSFAKTAALGMELCGTYTEADDPGDPTSYGVPQAATLLSLHRGIDGLEQAAANRRTAGLLRCRQALPFVPADSASPMESRIALTLALPVARGGWGIDGLTLNAPIELTEEQRLIAQLPYLSFDGHVLGSMLGYEYDSKMFHEGLPRDSVDRARLAAAQALGYTILPLTLDLVKDERRFFAFCDEFARLAGKRRRKVGQRTWYRRSALREELGFPHDPLREQGFGYADGDTPTPLSVYEADERSIPSRGA